MVMYNDLHACCFEEKKETNINCNSESKHFTLVKPANTPPALGT